MTERSEKSFPELVERQKSDAEALFDELLRQDEFYGGNLLDKESLPGWENVRFLKGRIDPPDTLFGKAYDLTNNLYGVHKERGMVFVDRQRIKELAVGDGNYEELADSVATFEHQVGTDELFIEAWTRSYKVALSNANGEVDSFAKKVDAQSNMLDIVKSSTTS